MNQHLQLWTITHERGKSTLLLDTSIEHDVSVFLKSRNQLTNEQVEIDAIEISQHSAVIPGKSGSLFKVVSINGKPCNDTYVEATPGNDYQTDGKLFTWSDLLGSGDSQYESSSVPHYLSAVKDLESAHAPKIYGIAEFAECIGWEKVRLSNSVRRLANGNKVRLPLPAPIQKLSSTPIWTEVQVMTFKQFLLDNEGENE